MRISELREQKKTSRQIAKELGVTRHHVEWRLRYLKVPKVGHRGRPTHSRWNDQALRERVKELHGLGLVIAEIAKRTDLSKNTVSGFCYRAGLTRRQKNQEYQPTPNPFPEPGICLWPGVGEDIVFDCPEHQHKYVDRTGQVVSSPYCKKHHRRAHWDVDLKPPAAPQENNVVKIA